jgi:hypothetical protein
LLDSQPTPRMAKRNTAAPTAQRRFNDCNMRPSVLERRPIYFVAP